MFCAQSSAEVFSSSHADQIFSTSWSGSVFCQEPIASPDLEDDDVTELHRLPIEGCVSPSFTVASELLLSPTAPCGDQGGTEMRQTPARNKAFDDYVLSASIQHVAKKQSAKSKAKQAGCHVEKCKAVEGLVTSTTTMKPARHRSNRGVLKSAPRPTRSQKDSDSPSAVDRPLTWQTYNVVHSLVNTFGPPLPPTMDLLATCLGKRYGMSHSLIERIMNNIPRKLSLALTETLGALLEPTPAEATDIPSRPPIDSAATKVPNPTVLEQFPQAAYVKMHLDWSTGAINVQINKGMATFYGMHPEELFSRMMRGMVPGSMTDFDQLCHGLDDLFLMFSGEPSGTTWRQKYALYGTPTDGGKKDSSWRAGFVRMTSKITYDAHARVELIEKWMQPASSAEFQVACKTLPEACRPIQVAVGDTRGPAELQCAFEGEFKGESMGVMAHSQVLRWKLDALANVVRQRYAPLLERRRAKQVEIARQLDQARRQS